MLSTDRAIILAIPSIPNIGAEVEVSSPTPHISELPLCYFLRPFDRQNSLTRVPHQKPDFRIGQEGSVQLLQAIEDSTPDLGGGGSFPGVHQQKLRPYFMAHLGGNNLASIEDCDDRRPIRFFQYAVLLVANQARDGCKESDNPVRSYLNTKPVSFFLHIFLLLVGLASLSKAQFELFEERYLQAAIFGISGAALLLDGINVVLL
jgi:hypothetical protein